MRVVDGLERGGTPRAAISDAIRGGAISLDWVERAGYERFSAEADMTFRS